MAKRPQSSMACLDEGQECDPRDLLYKKAGPEDRKCEALVTISAVTKGGYWKHTSAFNRKEMAKQVVLAYESIRLPNGSERPTMRVSCAREPHNRGDLAYHYHLVMSAEGKIGTWHLLGKALAGRRIAADVRVSAEVRNGLRKRCSHTC